MNDYKTERLLLYISLFFVAFFFVIGTLIAFASDSVTILLDSMQTLLTLFTTAFAIRVLKLVHSPANKDFHFGYFKLEPFIVMIENTILIGICIFTIILAVQDIVNPDPVHHYGLIIFFETLGTIVGITIGMVMTRKAKQIKSNLLKSDGILWFTDGLLSFGILVAFLINLLLKETSLAPYTIYTDPAVAILLVLCLLKKPMGLVREAARDLVDATPDVSIHRALKKNIKTYVKNAPSFSIKKIKVRPAGRRLFIEINCRADKKTTLEELDELKVGIKKCVFQNQEDALVNVLFSAKT